jgi:hypothetical protein
MTTADTIHPDQEIEWLKRQLTWLLDKEAIRKVKQQYCRYSDNGRFDDFEKLFTDDYHSEINGPPTGDGSAPQLLTFPSREAWVSFARTQGALRARVDATAGTEGPDKAATGFKGASGWNPGAAHHMHGGEIESTGPDTARAIWPSQFDGINGYYDEEYRKVDGVWKIARGHFFAQARREYHETDYPYKLEIGQASAE